METGSEAQSCGHAALRGPCRRIRAAGRGRRRAGVRRLSAMDFTWSSAGAIADAVRSGQASARDVVADALQRIAARNGALNAFTAVLEQRAIDRAHAIDQARGKGDRPGPLAGV